MLVDVNLQSVAVCAHCVRSDASRPPWRSSPPRSMDALVQTGRLEQDLSGAATATLTSYAVVTDKMPGVRLPRPMQHNY